MKMYRKNNQKKRMVLLCLLCLAGILACGCKAGDGSADSAAGGTASGGSDNGAGNTASEKGTNRRAKGQEDKDAMPKGGTEPDLEGEVKELKENEFTAIAHKTWDAEDGSVCVSPVSDNDADFEKVLVSFDEDTDVSIRTIYDGGERYEDAKAEAKDLKEGVSVNVWGKRSGEVINAEAIQIIKVVF